ncbi:MAG: ATP-binding protein [Clostridia bacterium]|nr:ATP-binding protein [Clostridia bacterium]
MENYQNPMANAMAEVIYIADKENPEEEGDYTVDGILHCGKCHTPKRCIVPGMCGVGYLYVGTPCQCRKEAEQKKKEAEQREKIADLRKFAFDTAGMYEKTFANDDGDTPTLTNIAKNFANITAVSDKAEWFGLLLFGDVDGGKSYAAAAVVNDLVDKGIPCLMRTLISLANDLFKTDNKNEYLYSLDRYRLLVLDDLGAERTSPWMYENIYQIIDYRLRSGLPMIITANLTWDEIRNPTDKQNKRIYSRVMEACHPEEVKPTGRRNRKAAERYKTMHDKLRRPVDANP